MSLCKSSTGQPGPDIKSLDDVWPVGKKAAYFALSITFLLGFFDFMDRQILAALFPYIKAEFALSDTQLGMLVSVTNLGIAVLVIPSAYLVDHVGRRKMLCFMGVLWSMATGACAFAGTYGHLLACRAFIGVGEAGYGPSSNSLLTVIFPRRVRSTVISFNQTGTTLGISLGLVIGAFVAQRWGWRHALGLVAVPGFFVALLALRVKDFKAAPAPEKAQADGGRENKDYWRNLRKIFTPSMFCLYLIFISRTLFAMTLMAWLPSFFIRDAGMSPTRASGVVATYLLLNAVMTFVSGPVMDFLRHFGNRAAIAWHIVASFLLMGLCFVLFRAAPGGSWLQIGALFAIPVVGMGYSPLLQSFMADLTVPTVRATAVGLQVTLQNVFGMMVGPLVVGILSDLFELRTALMLVSLMFIPFCLGFCLLYFRLEHDVAKVDTVVLDFGGSGDSITQQPAAG